MTTRRTFPTLALAASVFVLTGLTPGLTGCVAQNELDQFRDQYRLSQEQILDLQAQLEDRERQIAILRDAKNPNSDLQAQLADALADKASLEAALAKARDQLARAGTTPIPVELADELEALANANPDLMSYDKETGAIRFRSDVTFGSGKAELRESAVPLVNQLSTVLVSPAASDYEVRVVGHTDNVPIRNAFVKQQFGDNWGLSVARARSVMIAFRSAGVPEARMSIAGYGEFRPVEPNGPRGSEANRRVEVFLTPQPESPSAPPSASSTAPATTGTALSPTSTVVPLDDSPSTESPEAFK
ncbi:MAG: OmpA family protein [Planctomycetota bacterium]